MARIEYERVFWHLVLDKGSGTGEHFDHTTIQAWRNAGHTITFIADANDDDPDEWEGHFVCTLTADEARALAQQLLAEAATLDASPAGA